ncbi:MAG: S8 family serine peptidase, partial [Desulfatiglandales bacterium]
LIAGMIIPGLAICAPSDELLVDYNSTEITSKLPLWSTGEIIVKFDNDITEDYRNMIIREYGCSVVGRCLFSNVQLVRIPESLTAAETVDIFQQEEAVDYAELNYYARIALVPDDTFYFYQWNLNNEISGGIGAQAAWDIQIGDPNVVVAVLDTGVAYEDFETYKQAPDLSGTSFVAGYDFVNNDSHANDDKGHGTHVTGTIAQSTNNSMGAAGVAFGCSIMPVKVLNHLGTGSHFDIARGIYFATNNGAKVINMSLGGEGDSITLRDAVGYAYSQGVTVVCAVGNEFLQGNPTAYPAAYDDYCIAVGATRYDETRAYYSNTGSYLDVVAPGGDLLVDQNGDGYPDGILQQTFSEDPNVFAYWFFQGTSMAAPHVSGAAALLISNGLTDPDKVREVIEKTAKDIGSGGWDKEYGWGLINVWAALNYEMRGDLNGDLLVGTKDLSLLANQWPRDAALSPIADLSGDGVVNFVDFAILAEKWSK